ncbi:Fic family protein [Aureispira sp. CCB-E]|uniref:Fic family protein n=1 Tax=Aureispira sp. CCB-E TaxID=3051121 RepID=UPI002868FB50|nr:Fic family protein [Aureispira sp. CCB-E]WMX15902.1 Fic family protein [Aureispira sp. CCB-E]
MDWKKYIEKINAIQKEIAQLPPLSVEQKSKLWYRIRLDWNYHSNAMEGNTLTISETATLLVHGYHAGNKLGRHYEEMKLHNDVLFYLLDIVREDRAINATLIRELHAAMMGENYNIDAQDPNGNLIQVNGRPGQYKNKPNFVERGTKKYSYTSVEDVEPKMQELVEWLRIEEEKKELHPVQIATTFHVRFVTIHPFDDGNGRIGRILMNLILMRAELAPAIIPREDKPTYLDALVIAQDTKLKNQVPLLNLIAKETFNAMELRLKAYRGESLERQDDWEKEVALLKQELEAVKSPVLKMSAELIRDCVLGSIEPLFHRFAEKMNDNFDHFFLEHETFYGVDQTDYDNKEAFEEELMKKVNPTTLDIQEVRVGIRLKGFKLPDYENFSINEAIKVHFSNYNYEVFIDGRQKDSNIIKRYSEAVSQEEGNALIAQVGKKVTARIQHIVQRAKNENNNGN